MLLRAYRKLTKLAEARCGFSYIEVLIVIALMAAASVGGSLYLSKFHGGRQLDAAVRAAGAAFGDAQQRSIVQQNGKYWGVLFENVPDQDRYSLFSATDASLAGYAAANTAYLPSVAQLSAPTSSLAVLFDKLSGAMISPACPSTVASTTVVMGGRAIRIYCNGKIE
jgi:type II secretory pathway pseudopilin PulG